LKENTPLNKKWRCRILSPKVGGLKKLERNLIGRSEKTLEMVRSFAGSHVIHHKD